MNMAVQTKDDTLLKQALNILDWSLDIGWDEKYGGIYYFRDVYGRPCLILRHCVCFKYTFKYYKSGKIRK